MKSTVRLFPFHKHLMQMECRKDIIFENNFTNQKTKSKSVSFNSKYAEKLKQNKMRIAYLFGFSVVFSLNFLYDFVFQSKLYNKIHSEIFDTAYLSAIDEIHKNKVNYKNEEAVQLGKYFLQLQRKYPRNDITASTLSGMTPAFAELGDQTLNVNDFVHFCQLHSVKYADLPRIL